MTILTGGQQQRITVVTVLYLRQANKTASAYYSEFTTRHLCQEVALLHLYDSSILRDAMVYFGLYP